MRKVVIATNNANKLKEITQILNLEGYEFYTLNDLGIVSDPVEDADSFKGNALIKAMAAHIKSGGLCALADDSGLVVDALDGAPGVFSSRYAGDEANDEDNNKKLLEEMADVPSDKRTARFVCNIAFVDEEGNAMFSEGMVEGEIAYSEKGENGFGYDPLFLPYDFPGRTLAEVLPEEKNAISHRAKALNDIKNKLISQNPVML